MRTPRDPLYAGYRYPAALISYAIWLYFRFPLSLRMVEEMLAARGISVTYETIRQWSVKFGREFANRIRRRAPRCGDKWHLDEVVITIAGKMHWLWRAVDQDGFVLDVLVQSRRGHRQLSLNRNDFGQFIGTSELTDASFGWALTCPGLLNC